MNVQKRLEALDDQERRQQALMNALPISILKDIRVANTLAEGGCRTVLSVHRASDAALLQINNIGAKTIDAIRKTIAEAAEAVMKGFDPDKETLDEWKMNASQTNGNGHPKLKATKAPPGSKEKLDILAERMRAGLPLYAAGDREGYDDLVGAVPGEEPHPEPEPDPEPESDI